MRKHRRNVLRHLRTAEFEKLTKKGERLLAEAERLDNEGELVTYEINSEDDIKRMLADFNRFFDELRNEKHSER